MPADPKRVVQVFQVRERLGCVIQADSGLFREDIPVDVWVYIQLAVRLSIYDEYKQYATLCMIRNRGQIPDIPRGLEEQRCNYLCATRTPPIRLVHEYADRCRVSREHHGTPGNTRGYQRTIRLKAHGEGVYVPIYVCNHHLGTIDRFKGAHTSRLHE